MLEDTTCFSRYDLTTIKRKMSSWSKIANLMYKTKDPEVVKELLFAEIHSLNRPYNVIRLYQRFNRLRCDNELNNIFDFVKDVNSSKELLEPLRNQQTLSIYLDAHEPTMELYKELIFVEAFSKNRRYMIKLLYGKYQILRRAKELKEHGINKGE